MVIYLFLRIILHGCYVNSNTLIIIIYIILTSMENTCIWVLQKRIGLWCHFFVTKIFEEKNVTRRGVTFYFNGFTDDIHLYTHIICMCYTYLLHRNIPGWCLDNNNNNNNKLVTWFKGFLCVCKYLRIFYSYCRYNERRIFQWTENHYPFWNGKNNPSNRHPGIKKKCCQ